MAYKPVHYEIQLSLFQLLYAPDVTELCNRTLVLCQQLNNLYLELNSCL